MRHLLANLAVYVLAVGLVLVAALFAWLRTSQTVIASERRIEPVVFSGQAAPRAEVLAYGEGVYVANCQNCHGRDGLGRDVYPPVVGQEAVRAAPGGEAYLNRIILYGLWTGAHAAPMPPTPNLSDVQIAAVNTFILERFRREPLVPGAVPLAGGDVPFTPEGVRAERGQAFRERDIGRQRPAVPAPAVLAEP